MIMSVSMDSTDMLLVTLLVILVGYFLFQKQSESSSNSNVSTRLGKNSRAKSKRGWPTFTLIESIDLSEDSKQLKLKIPNGTYAYGT